eukprot:gene29969-37111_t
MSEFGKYAKSKHVVITGANVGLGLETATSLAKYGAVITIACRSKTAGEEAVTIIKAAVPEARVSFLQLDLSSAASVRKFAVDYKATRQPLNILINNAGLASPPLSLTADGLESQFGVNHIGHFILTTELLDLLKQSGTEQSPSRVVNLASMGAYLFAPPQGIRFDDLKGEKNYSPWERYGSAKLANVLFTNELDRRLKAEGANVLAVSLHPGSVAGTSLGRHIDFSGVMDMFSLLWRRRGGIYSVLFGTVYKTVKQGSATTLFCALSPTVSRGAYYSDCRVETRDVHERAGDGQLMSQLWSVSEEIVKGI